MKKLVIIAALVASILVPTSAQAAQTTFAGGPLTNLDSPASIHIALSNFPTAGGLYVMECVQSQAGLRPTLCNAAVQLWVSRAVGASFIPTADIVLKPTASFTSGSTAVDCRISKCGVFLRYDHTLPGNLSEDQFISLTFKSGSTASTKPVDEIIATINGLALSSRVPTKIAYRQVANLAATAKSGSALTYVSLAPACALKSMSIIALKGSGYCDIAVTSLGNHEFAGLTAHFPLELTVGVQTISKISMNSSARSILPKKTNFGELITYVSSGSCTLSKNIIKASKGTCTLDLTAPGLAGLYQPLTTRVVTVVK